jgi:hypothetical protein
VEEGGSLTMINGTLDGAAAGTEIGFYTVGAELMLSGVDVVGCETALYVADNMGQNAQDSKIHLFDCELDAPNFSIVVKGNGTKSEQLTQLVVEKCTIKTDLVGISGNGSKGQEGTDIQVIDTTITGKANMVTTGIFHPQADSKLTIYNSIITAYTGVAIKGGSISVIESEIYGTGEKQAPAFHGSGCADTGDAIYIETNYEGDVLLEISGNSKIGTKYGYSLQVYKPNAPNVTVRIYSGEFDQEQPEEYIAEGSEQTGTTIKRKS